MTKIKELIAALRVQVDSQEKRLDRVDEILEWAAKLVIGTLVVSAIGLLFMIKKV